MTPQWQTALDSDVIEIGLNPGSVLVVLISPSGDAVCSVLLPADIRKLGADRALLSQWFGAVDGRFSQQGTVRLFGSEHDFAAVLDLIVPYGTLQRGAFYKVKQGEFAQFHFIPSEGRVRAMKVVGREASAPLARATSRTGPKRVLVVDDSPSVCKLLESLIGEDGDLVCVGTVTHPSHAEEAIQRLKPDVVTLDIHMPEMDGVTLLRQILSRGEIPIVMVSALSIEEGGAVLDALEAGAVDYIQKPSLVEARAQAASICERLKNAAMAKVRAGSRPPAPLGNIWSGDVHYHPSSLIALGASTGGTDALKVVLTGLPENIPPIVIVQHIPPVFSKAFADRMDSLCAFEVVEAQHGDAVIPNKVFIAPGDHQMKVIDSPQGLRISLDQSPPVNRHRPSVDVLFESVALLKSRRVAAAVLTGMGSDGAKGLKNLRDRGARTWAQDEASSVVYGMPKEAFEKGGAEKVVSLEKIASQLVEACRLNGRQENKAS